MRSAALRGVVGGDRLIDDESVVADDLQQLYHQMQPFVATPQVEMVVGSALVGNVHPVHPVVVVIDDAGSDDLRLLRVIPHDLDVILVRHSLPWLAPHALDRHARRFHHGYDQHDFVVGPACHEGAELVHLVLEGVEERVLRHQERIWWQTLAR